MAAFKVGDRVRVVGALDHPENIGAEGVIVCWATDIVTRAGEIYAGWMVRIPAGVFGTKPGWLEPIKPLPSIAEILAMENLPEGPVREFVFVGQAA